MCTGGHHGIQLWRAVAYLGAAGWGGQGHIWERMAGEGRGTSGGQLEGGQPDVYGGDTMTYSYGEQGHIWEQPGAEGGGGWKDAGAHLGAAAARVRLPLLGLCAG